METVADMSEIAPKKRGRPRKMQKDGISQSFPEVRIIPDDDDCFPVPDTNCGFELKVGSKSEEMNIPPRMSFVLDCGCALELPKGMHVNIEIDPQWATRGLALTALSHSSGGCRLRVVANNVGKQILAFENGQKIGRFWFVSATQVALIPVK